MSANTLRMLIGIIMIAHGLVHYSLTTVPVPRSGALRTPYWPSLRRVEIDSQWLASRLGLPDTGVRTLGSLLVIGATAAFVLAGLGLLGVSGLNSAWTVLAVLACAVSLGLHLFYWHPWLVMGVVIDIAVLAGIVLKFPATLFP